MKVLYIEYEILGKSHVINVIDCKINQTHSGSQFANFMETDIEILVSSAYIHHFQHFFNVVSVGGMQTKKADSVIQSAKLLLDTVEYNMRNVVIYSLSFNDDSTVNVVLKPDYFELKVLPISEIRKRKLQEIFKS